MSRPKQIIASDPSAGKGKIPRNGIFIALLLIITSGVAVFWFKDSPTPQTEVANSTANEAVVERLKAQSAPSPLVIDELESAAIERQTKDARQRDIEGAQAVGPRQSSGPGGVRYTPQPYGTTTGTNTGTNTDNAPGPSAGAASGVMANGSTPTGTRRAADFPAPINSGGSAVEQPHDDELAKKAELLTAIGNAPAIVFDGEKERAGVPAPGDLLRAQIAGLSNAASAVPVAAGGGDGAVAAALRGLGAASSGTDLAAASGKRNEWVKEFNASTKADVTQPTPRAARWMLTQGTVIPAVLAREINSDLPGTITAVVMSDVYDSLSQSRLLIPAHAKLYGRYDSGVVAGQERLMFAFSRMTLPDGSNIDLRGATGADQAGRAGVTGDVNNHFLKQFGAALLVAIAGDYAASKRDQSSGTVVVSSGGVQTQSAQAFSDVARSILDRHRNIPPTISVRAGEIINVEVSQDILFPDNWVGLRKAAK